jgi:hypothetical protein
LKEDDVTVRGSQTTMVSNLGVYGKRLNDFAYLYLCYMDNEIIHARENNLLPQIK